MREPRRRQLLPLDALGRSKTGTVSSLVYTFYSSLWGDHKTPALSNSPSVRTSSLYVCVLGEGSTITTQGKKAWVNRVYVLGSTTGEGSGGLAKKIPLGSCDNALGIDEAHPSLVVPLVAGSAACDRAPCCHELTGTCSAAPAVSSLGHRRTAVSWAAASPPQAWLHTPRCRC